MRPFIIITLVGCVYLLSCSQSENNAPDYSTRDSLIKVYLGDIDSLPYYDTTEDNYQMLKAYHKNDTALIKNALIKNREAREYERKWSFTDSCVHQMALQDLGVDEAYRMIYYPAFCTMPISVTLTKKGDSANLHFLLYEYAHDTVACRIISNYNRKLDINAWAEFRSKLWYGDIWGLKRENGIHGNDGTTLTVIGYQSGKPWNTPDKISYANRWSYSSLSGALEFALVLSGNKKGCYWVQYK